MNLKQLRYFTTIASCKSLSMAAKQLGISQPALSKYLASLESELQLPLFYRDKKQMHLTKAGRIYLQSAQKIIDLENATRSSIQNLQSGNTHSLRIGVTPHEGVQAIASLIPKFQSRFPQCEMTLKEGYTFELYRYVQEKSVDIALTTDLATPFNLDFIPFFRRELLLCMSSGCKMPGNQAAFPAEPVRLIEFINMPFVLFDENTSIGSASRGLFEREGLTPLVAYETSNSIMVNRLVCEGLGCGFMPANNEISNDKVIYFHIENPVYIEYGLLKHPYHSLSKTERYLVSELIKAEQRDSSIQGCKDDRLDRIMKEFETPPEVSIKEDV
ncbi:MAG: LysR family transcriptional regulator [Lachnospiraceae bacterium]|nr:LysR family transcriptional regulator [Lachnospiraceae bacterium]